MGQGDASLIQTREAAVLVDAGLAIAGGIDLGASAVVPALRALGVSRLDLVSASHADADHRGGLPAVVARFPVGQVWLPPGGLQDPAFSALLASARGKGVPVYDRGAGDPGKAWGDLVVTPLWPPRDLSGTRNARSLVLRIDVGAARILLPGDMGSEAEHALLRSGADLRADVLKLAHHGSRFSSSPAFLAAVGADVAIVSAACGRRHLPTADALTRTREAGASLWWTGRDGAVFVSLATPLATWSWAAPWPGCVARAR